MARFSDAVEFISIPACKGYSFDNKSIEAVAANYLRNMLRIQSLGRLPILVTGAAWMTATYDMVARHELHSTHNDPRLDPDAVLFDPELARHKEFIRMKLQREWFERSKKGETKSGMDIGEDWLAYFTSYENEELSEGINAVLIGMITGMWTSFEVLAEDLWNTAIKERPLLNQNWTNKERETSGFRSVKKLKNLYNYTFRQDAADIQRTIGDERIEGLALVRNLLTHKGGRIDTEFNDRRANIPSLSCFDVFQLHQEIEVSGPIVKHLIGPIPILGLDLINYIDKWISNHP